MLMDNRKEASCVTVAGDLVRPGFAKDRGCASIPQCLLRGEFVALGQIWFLISDVLISDFWFLPLGVALKRK